MIVTIKAFNAACNYVSQIAHETKTYNRVHLHKASYYPIRETFGLPSQMAIRVIGRIIETYRRDKKLHRFRDQAAMVLDNRLLSFKSLDRVSILTLSGRVVLPFVFGTYGGERLSFIKGEADLIYRDGQFFLLQTIDLPEPPTINPDDFLGLDLGVANIVSDSDGERHAGNKVNRIRHRAQHLRTKLQKTGTRPAKRLLKMRRRKEARFARDVNHCISKQLVNSTASAFPAGGRRETAFDWLRGLASGLPTNQNSLLSKIPRSLLRGRLQ